MARTSYNNGQSFQTNQKHSLFCSVHLAFSSCFAVLFFSLLSRSCTLVSSSMKVRALVALPCNAFFLVAANHHHRRHATISKRTNFHSLSLYPVHFISVTFYLKIYDCCSFFCVRLLLPLLLFRLFCLCAFMFFHCHYYTANTHRETDRVALM